MKRIVVSIAVALALLGLRPFGTRAAKPATVPAPTTETSPGVYRSEKYEFTLKTPEDWKRAVKLEKVPVVLAITAGDPPAGQAATVVRIEYKPVIRLKLDAVATALGKAATENDPKAQASPVGNGLLGGSPAKRLTVVRKVKGILTRTMYLLTIKNGHLYTFSVDNDAGQDPVKDTIETSFQFLN